MQVQDKELKALVRSMNQVLKTEHQLTVPHSALRAALLKACGQNPHALAKGAVRQKQANVDELQQLVNQAPQFFHPGYDFDGEKVEWLKRAGLIS